MTALSVNLNKIALVRNTRALGIPSVRKFAAIALEAGADGITVHPRPDGRHVRGDDVRELAALLAQWPAAEFNIEGNPFHQLMDYVREVRPQQCTFVPDETGAFTSDHGWDLPRDGARLRPLVDGARELGADRVELYTEPYAQAFGTPQQGAQLARYRAAAEAAQAAGLGVNAGHDLNLANLSPFLGTVRGVLEVSIGHALTADALEFGMACAVGRYLAAIRGAEASLRETT